ncbi:MAG: TIGR00296 family protein [Nitrososphaeria archaeon]
MELSDEDGTLLVKLARKAIEERVNKGSRYIPPEEIRQKFSKEYGVFVTINRVRDGDKELRGCIGFPQPVLPLADAVVDSAISAATEDPRFSPMKKNELDKVILEVSVLTPLQLIEVRSPLEYPHKIKVGEDGLVFEWEWGSGLLLPQVAVEYGWDASEFLENVCMKAGAPPDSWLRKGIKIYKFKAIIWEETREGKVVRKKL